MTDQPALAPPLTGPLATVRAHRVAALRRPSWTTVSLLGLLAVTAVLYLWDLGASGWANSFYSAAVLAGTRSWKAFLFGSFDASNFITVDKPPASLWVMEISARLFGVNAWSILVPQALEGVAAVGLLYAAVRRRFGHAAGLIAGAVCALTPVAALMFRYNNPDALLVLLLVASAYAMTRALEDGRTRWLALAGVLVGFAFLTKTLQSFLVLPGFAAVYLLAAPVSVRKRILQLLGAGLTVVVSGGWWVALVTLWPAAARPYIGGSTNNSELNLIFGYNGFGRITGNEVGSVVAGGGAGGAGVWGPTGLLRMFSDTFGGQCSWLIPAALILGAGLLWLRGRAPRSDGKRAAALLWGGWLLVTGLLFSFAQGIIHPYYTVALAPAIGALVGIGGVELWLRRDRLAARGLLAAALAATVIWAFALLSQSPDWLPWLRFVILQAGLLTAAALLAPPIGGPGLAGLLAGCVLATALAGPAAYVLDTVATPHTGSIPSAGPATTDAATGPGGGGPLGGATAGLPGGGPTGAGQGGSATGRTEGGIAGGTGGPPALGGTGGGPGGGAPRAGVPSGLGGGVPAQGTLPGGSGAPSGGGPSAGNGGATNPGGTLPGGLGAGGGGLLNAGTPSAALTAALEKDASRYTWVAAAVGAQNAAGYELATGDPVMAIGGFNGTDPWPTLAVFERLVAEHEIHYFIASGSGGGGGAGESSESSAITSWVESHFSSVSIGGTNLYDLTSPLTSNAS
jgi:4-amino-4-deoxy-L-arabinose transferase-like glycosyltransferase